VLCKAVAEACAWKTSPATENARARESAACTLSQREEQRGPTEIKIFELRSFIMPPMRAPSLSTSSILTAKRPPVHTCKRATINQVTT
jgi:hypothetical protein